MKMILNDLISVIVPVYGVEFYLPKCVDSIRKQTYSNLEILLVDDGSLDTSAIVCDDTALQDQRLVVIHKPNGGLSDARNMGMLCSSGSYIGFVDSDDYIHPDMYQVLYKLIREKNAQLSECRAAIFNEGETCEFDISNENVYFYDQTAAIEELLMARNITTTVWNKLIEFKLAKEIQFDVGKIHEDILWTYRVLNECKGVAVTINEYYAYLQRDGSISNAFVLTRKRFDAFDAYKKRAELIKLNHPMLFPRAEEAYIGSCMYYYQLLCRQKRNEDIEKMKSDLYKRVCSSDLEVVFPLKSIKDKIQLRLFVQFPGLICLVRNTCGIGR